MSQQIPESQYQEQDNLIQNTNIRGNLTFAPVQIGTKIETQIVKISEAKVTQQPLIKTSPYQGLKRFNLKDRDRFFGRDKLIARLFAAINRSSLSLVLGASGSGKSSVVRAGLIPELRKSLESSKFYDFIFTPNDDPFEYLYRCLLSEEKDYNFRKSEAKIARQATVGSLTEVIRKLKQEDERWLIFVDQFEELFTSCDDLDKRNNFIANLVQVANSGDNSVKIVLAMRADFLEQLSSYPDLVAIINQNNNHIVADMHPDELRQAIEQPAAKHGVVFEDGLVEQIIKEVQGQKGYLPLLQYTLNLLWQTECNTLAADGRLDIEDRTLNQTTYSALEGVRGALQKRVNEIYHNLNQEEQSATKQIFVKLVNIVDSDSGSKTVSRRANRSEFVSESVNNTLQTFIDENLLVSSVEDLSTEKLHISDDESLKKSATVEIAHEILLSSWDRLKRWIEEEKEAIILKNWLAGETKRWQRIRAENESQAREELLKGSRLKHVVDFRNKDAFKNVGGLRAEENEFIDVSVAETERIEQEKEARRKRDIRIAWGFIGVVMLGAIGSAYFGIIARKQALNAELQAEAVNIKYSLSLEATTEKLIEAIELTAKSQANQKSLKPTVLNEVNSILLAALDQVRERNLFQGHTATVNEIAFSPDGKQILSGSRDNTMRLWDRESGKLLHTFEGHTMRVSAIAFSPDGQQILSGSRDSTVRLWDRDSGKLLHSFEGQDFNRVIAFSSDGQQILSDVDSFTLELWDRESGKLLGFFNVGVKDLSSFSAVAISPDGQYILTGTKGTRLLLWDKESFSPIRSFNGHTDSVSAIAFSPDGQQILSGSRDKTIRLWDRDSGKLLHTFDGHTDSVSAITFSLDGQQILSGSWDKTIRLWDRESGKLLHTFKGHTSFVWAIAFSPDGQQILSGSGHDLKENEDNTVRLWDIESGKLLQTFEGHVDSVRAIAFSPDGKQILSGSIHDLNGSGEPTVRLWDRESGKLLHSFEGHLYDAKAIAFSPDGKQILSGSGIGRYGVGDTIVQLWDRESGKLLHSFEGHTDSVLAIVFSPDGKQILSSSEDKTVRLWDRESGKLLHTFEGHTQYVLAISFSPDGKQILSSSEDKTVRLWDRDSGKLLQTFEGHTDSVSAIAFSPDGQQILSGSKDKTIRLWDRDSGKLLQPFEGHTSSISAIAFSPDGKYILSSSKDKTMRLWDRDSGKLLHIFEGHTDGVNKIAFSPDGKQILSGSDDKTMRLWLALDGENLLKEGCNKLRLHPALVEPKNESAAKACLDYAGWEDTTKAEFLVRQGWFISQIEQNFKGAVTKFNEAQKLDSSIDSKEWEAKAGRLVASVKVEEGGKLAQEEKIKEAIALYKEAQQLDPEIDLNPSTEAIDKDPEVVARALAGDKE